MVVSGPTGPFTNLTGVTISPNTDFDFENEANPRSPQRNRAPYDITFTKAALTKFPTSGSRIYQINASLAIAATKVPGSDALTQFELTAGVDP